MTHIKAVQLLACLALLCASISSIGAGIADRYAVSFIEWIEPISSTAVNDNEVTTYEQNTQTIYGSSSTAGTVWKGNKIYGLVGAFGSRPQKIQPLGINNKQIIVGMNKPMDGNYIESPTVWKNGLPVLLPTPLSVQNGYTSLYSPEASAINNKGTIVGITYANNITRATVWDVNTNGGYTLSILPVFVSQWESTAKSINDKGVIVGTARNAQNSARHAALWTSSRQLVDLGAIGGVNRNSRATCINNLGAVVGDSEDASSNSKAFLWKNNVMVDLGAGPPGRWVWSAATAINDDELIVGVVTDFVQGHAAAWHNGTFTDLNDRLPTALADAGWVLVRAYGVNKSGTIVGSARNNLLNLNAAFRMVPLP